LTLGGGEIYVKIMGKENQETGLIKLYNEKLEQEIKFDFERIYE